jgi:hypothetical protein
MSSDPGDLANMAGLALPASVSFWPPAAGAWIVGVAAAVMLAVATGRVIQRYRADAYLRRATTEIDDRIPIARLSEVLKRAAMVAYGRDPVASLTGAGWAEFLARTGRKGETDILASELTTAITLDGTAQPSAVAQARGWLAMQRGRVSREA